MNTTSARLRSFGILAALASTLVTANAIAQETAKVPAPASPYALPFQLRPISPSNSLRFDTAASFHGVDSSNWKGTSDVSIVTANLALTKTTGFGLRLPFVYNAPSGDGAPSSQFQLGNPALTLTHTPFPADSLRFSFFAAGELPVAPGGGTDASAAAKAANASAQLVRLTMDSLLFLPNDAAVAVGTSCAYVADGLTVQADLTMLNTFKVRDVAGDAARTNGMASLGAGYFLASELSLHGEVLYQHWLTTPAAVAADSSKRHSLSALVGARFHHKLEWGWLRPGLALAQGVDGPVDKHTEVRLDVSVSF